MFDLYQFGVVCLWTIPLVIIATVFIQTLLKQLGNYPEWGDRACVIAQCLLSPGIVVHEAAHLLFCKIFGVKVKEVKFFGINYKRIKVKKKKRNREITTFPKIPVSVSGKVTPAEENRSMSVNLCIGFAPLIVNGLLVSLIIYFSSTLVETAYWGLFVYLAIALGMGSQPSKPDMIYFLHSFKQHPGRGFLEFMMLCVFGGILYCLIAVWQVDSWMVLLALTLFFAIIIIQGRVDWNRTKVQEMPRW